MGASKKAKRAHRGEYQLCATEWSRLRQHPDFGAANWMIDPIDPPVTPRRLLETLQLLYSVTQDREFENARSALLAYYGSLVVPTEGAPKQKQKQKQKQKPMPKRFVW